ncbi:hypothetical protein [Streptomyces sp. NPDC002640]
MAARFSSYRATTPVPGDGEFGDEAQQRARRLGLVPGDLHPQAFPPRGVGRTGLPFSAVST